MTDLDDFREKWKVELGLKENEKLNQGTNLSNMFGKIQKFFPD